MNWSDNGRRKVSRGLREDGCGLVCMPDTETGEVNFVLALGLMGLIPLDRGGFFGRQVHCSSDFARRPSSASKLEISFGRKELWTKARE